MDQEQMLKELALAHFENGRFADAARDFRRITAMQPESADAYYNLGLSLVASEELVEALVAFRRAFELNPTDVESGKNLVKLLLEQNQIEESKSVLKALEIFAPSDEGIRSALEVLESQSAEPLPEQTAQIPKATPHTPDSGSELDSRFFVAADRRIDRLLFQLPPHWWSRPSEYAWALQFAQPQHTVLDAACGISHPLKFYLADHCREAHACDIDDRIDQPDKMLEEIARDYAIDRKQIPEEVVQKPIYRKCSLTNLEYPDKFFDTIFCISVLEHLSLADFESSIKEFSRTLKEDGTIILTFDYPRVQLDEFERMAKIAGLRFAGEYDRQLPADALYSSEFKLYCFRAVLKKASVPEKSLFDYRSYWEERYRRSEGSGLGSYGQMAEFKADVVNAFVQEEGITSIVEYGCGDGNNLKYMHYPRYIGLDVAPSAVEVCRSLFSEDHTKAFEVYIPGGRNPKALPSGELVVCLDVLYHIIPDNEYYATLKDVFASAEKYVILFTSIDAFLREPYREGSHVRHRDTMSDLRLFPGFVVESIIEEKYPEISSAHFIILRRMNEIVDARSQTRPKRHRIGFVTIWFERGQSYVTKALRDALSLQHDTFIFARTGFVDGQFKMETDGFWSVENLTTHPTYDIAHDALRAWATANHLDTIVFNEEYDWSLVEFAKTLGVRVVTYLDYLKEDWLPKMHLYDAVLCSTRRSYEIVKNASQATYIGWGIDTDLFFPQSTTEKKHTFFHNAGWLGTNYRKMTPAVLLAFDSIAPMVPDASLFIHFQSAKERLPEQAQAILESNPRIHAHFGSVPAPGLYHQGNVLLFPTKLEGLGLPLLEGLASGLAVIATNAAPMNEFVREGENGFLVPVAARGLRADGIVFPEEIIDVNALAATMLRLARDPRLINEVGRRARQYAVNELSVEAFARRINALEVFTVS